jgi:hypothetical protein
MPATENDLQRRVVPTQDARQGETSGHVRTMLGASLILAVVAGVFLYVMYFM